MQLLTAPAPWREFLTPLAGEDSFYPPADEGNLLAVEAKLKVKLPPSYRAIPPWRGF